jgi:hypothetical protein
MKRGRALPATPRAVAAAAVARRAAANASHEDDDDDGAAAAAAAAAEAAEAFNPVDVAHHRWNTGAARAVCENVILIIVCGDDDDAINPARCCGAARRDAA